MERIKLPKTRVGWTHKFTIYSQAEDGSPDTREFYLTYNTYPDGKLGEVFLKPAQRGDAMADQWCRALSVLVQRGADVEELLRLFEHTKFLPAGMTDNPEIPFTSSLTDYVVKYLCLRFGSADLKASRARHA